MQESELEKQDLSGYTAQIKLDGRRVQIKKQGTEVTMIPRSEGIQPWKYPELVEGLKKIPGNFLIDGELVVFGPDGNTDFDMMISRDKTKDRFKIRLLSKKYPATFVAFDILELEGQDLRKLTWEERNAKLLELTPNDNFEAVTSSDDIMQMLQQAHENNWEGIVLKLKTGTYEEARSPFWIKVKRKEYPILNMVAYEIHNKGLTLISDQGIRVACLGAQSGPVKIKIDKEGHTMCKISTLGGKLKSGKWRQPTFVSMEG